jgi:hypothetical protein
VQQTDIDRYKSEIEAHGDMSIRAKWTMDGARTLLEAAAKLRQEAAWLEELAGAGLELNAPIEDDYGFIGHPDVVPRVFDEDE